MFGLRRRGVASMHTGMTVDEVRQRFTGIGWELINAERTSVEEMVERRVGGSSIVSVCGVTGYGAPRTDWRSHEPKVGGFRCRSCGCYHICGTRR